MVVKFMVEKLESSWLKRPRLKGLGLKLGVEMSGVEMSFNLCNSADLVGTSNFNFRASNYEFLS